jgi:O-antigen/teichoic acid export membrane protein/GT2 family glycosyltransferase
VDKCSSEWIAFIDSDDVWLPDHLATLQEVKEKNSNVEWILANSILTDALLNPYADPQGFIGAFPVFKRSSSRFRNLFPLQAPQVVWHGDAKKQALMGNWLQPSGLFIRKDAFLKHGGFNECLWRCEDMDFLLRLVRSSPATLSLRETYMWRLGQSDSLASHQHALLLKRGAVEVLARSGFELVRVRPLLLLHWFNSLVRHVADYLFAKILRKTNELEHMPALQAVMQTCVAFLGLLTPVFLARLGTKEQFSDYRTFGFYLSSAGSLSLTSGFWSLLPFWKSNGVNAASKPTVAFNLNNYFAMLFAVFVYLISPMGSDRESLKDNMILSLSIMVLIPSMFLEQNLAISNRAFLGSFLVSMIEVSKLISIVAVTIALQNFGSVFSLICIFIFLRFLIMILVNARLKLIRFEPLNLNNMLAIFREALPICFAAAMFTFSVMFDRFYLSRMLSGEQFAIVVAGLLPLPLVGYLEQSVFQRILAPLATALRNGQLDHSRDMVARAVRRVSNIVIPVTAALMFCSEEIIQLLFGEKYHRSVFFLTTYLALNVGACIPADIFARAQGKSSRILAFGFVSCVLLCSCVIFGFKNFSAEGAVVASVLGMLVLRFGMLITELRRLNIDLIKFFANSFNTRFQALIVAGIVFTLTCIS